MTEDSAPDERVLVHKAWRQLAKRAEVEDEDEDESSLLGGARDAEWHQVRIAAKRARYAGEAAVAFARQMEKVTEILGEHQDAADAGAAIRELATSADARASFSLGVLCAAERER
jgi:CHAD domain-containing protein